MAGVGLTATAGHGDKTVSAGRQKWVAVSLAAACRLAATAWLAVARAVNALAALADVAAVMA